jgi:hypothetical protein
VKPAGSSSRGWVILVIGAIAAAALWLRRMSPPPEPAPAGVRVEPVRPPEVTSPKAGEPVAAVPPRVSISTAAPVPFATPEPELERPHPITPEHQRIFEENNRVGAMNGAMERADVEALKRLNAAYRRDYPEDDHALQEGYELIADCLERRTPEVVAAARRFWSTRRASALRRYVRRHCLEEPMSG